MCLVCTASAKLGIEGLPTKSNQTHARSSPSLFLPAREGALNSYSYPVLLALRCSGYCIECIAVPSTQVTGVCPSIFVFSQEGGDSLQQTT